MNATADQDDIRATLQTFSALPEHSRPPVTSIHLVEASQQLRGVQKLKLETTGFKDTETVWYGDIKEVPICELGWSASSPTREMKTVTEGLTERARFSHGQPRTSLPSLLRTSSLTRSPYTYSR